MQIDELSANKRLKGLSPKVFLSDEPKDKNKRRQTMDNLIGAIKIVTGKSFRIDEKRLSIYLKNRNLFVHEF